MRVFIGLLIVLALVAVQPGKALSAVLCTELGGRTILEFGTHGVCQPMVAAVEVRVTALAEPCCTGCDDRALSAEPTPTISGKRGEAPRSILPTGPPSQDVVTPLVPVFPQVAEADASGRRFGVISDFRDPFLVALRTKRLLT
mgnify:CR=1 FL=1